MHIVMKHGGGILGTGSLNCCFVCLILHSTIYIKARPTTSDCQALDEYDQEKLNYIIIQMTFITSLNSISKQVISEGLSCLTEHALRFVHILMEALAVTIITQVYPLCPQASWCKETVVKSVAYPTVLSLS